MATRGLAGAAFNAAKGRVTIAPMSVPLDGKGVLKGVVAEELPGLLEIARKERSEAPPAPERADPRRDARPQARPDNRTDRRPNGRPDNRPDNRSRGPRPEGRRPPKA